MVLETLARIGAISMVAPAVLCGSVAVSFVAVTIDHPDPQAESDFGNCGFGNSEAGLGDVDGDGVPDLAICTPWLEIDGERLRGRVYVFSGADQSVILTLDDPQPQAGAVFGFGLGPVGDLDGDGVRELAVSAGGKDIGGLEDVGQAFVFSGATGEVRLVLENPVPQADSFFLPIAGTGDLSGDGIPDLIVGDPGKTVAGNLDQGQVYVFSGADGELVRTVDHPEPERRALFGLRPAAVGDVDRDGVPDLAISAHFQDGDSGVNEGRAFVLSGRDGALLSTLDHPNAQAEAQFASALAAVGDLDFDGASDVAVGAPGQDVALRLNQGQAFVLSGADGSLLLELNDPNPQDSGLFGRVITGPGDVDLDGVVDVVVSTPRANVDGNDSQGRAYLFSGATGESLITFEHPDPQAGARFVVPATVGDVNIDGIVDLLGAASSQDVGDNNDQGRAYLLLSVLPPAEAEIEDLIDQVEGTAGPSALVNKLENVIKKLEQGNKLAALELLEAFIDQVEDQRGSKLSEQQADRLASEAQSIINLINLR